MPSIGGLTSHLTCLVYLPYLGKLYNPENHKVGGKNKTVILRMNEGNCTAAVRRAHSSKPAAAAVRRLDGTDGQVDGRTDGRKTVS